MVSCEQGTARGVGEVVTQLLSGVPYRRDEGKEGGPRVRQTAYQVALARGVEPTCQPSIPKPNGGNSPESQPHPPPRWVRPPRPEMDWGLILVHTETDAIRESAVAVDDADHVLCLGAPLTAL